MRGYNIGIKATCIEKFRDKNDKIIGYRLKDVDAKQLKVAIHNGQIDVDNLTLTSDGRIITSHTNDGLDLGSIAFTNRMNDDYNFYQSVFNPLGIEVAAVLSVVSANLIIDAKDRVR